MEKKLSTLIIISAIAVVVAICASILGVCALSRANALEERVAMLEAAAYAQEAIPSQDVPQQVLPETTGGTPQSDKVSLSLGDWSWEDSTLVIHTGYARVAVPEDDLAAVTLDVYADGKELEGCLLTMAPGEAADTMEAELSNISIPLEEDSLTGTIELRLIAQLKSGEELISVVGGWSFEGGSLMLISG